MNATQITQHSPKWHTRVVTVARSPPLERGGSKPQSGSSEPTGSVVEIALTTLSTHSR